MRSRATAVPEQRRLARRTAVQSAGGWVFRAESRGDRSHARSQVRLDVRQALLLGDRSYGTRRLIVPIETTLIAGASGFSEAVAQGIENLRNKAEFQYLVDIQTARERNVTPIPRWSVP